MHHVEIPFPSYDILAVDPWFSGSDLFIWGASHEGYLIFGSMGRFAGTPIICTQVKPRFLVKLIPEIPSKPAIDFSISIEGRRINVDTEARLSHLMFVRSLQNGDALCTAGRSTKYVKQDGSWLCWSSCVS